MHTHAVFENCCAVYRVTRENLIYANILHVPLY